MHQSCDCLYLLVNLLLFWYLFERTCISLVHCLQCQLDDSSPLAKEWGLWAIRNLCAGGAVVVQEPCKRHQPALQQTYLLSSTCLGYAVFLCLPELQKCTHVPGSDGWPFFVGCCAGSEAARTQIAALKPVAAVESPELSALGMRMEWDSSTGRMKVVRTEQQR
jgi:hypothetical protein